MQNVNNSRNFMYSGDREENVYGNSVLSAMLLCKYKTALKK